MRVPFAGIVDGDEEIQAVIRVIKSGWHGSGPQADAFEQEFAAYTGAKHCLMTNSGSSANLLALKSFNFPPGSKVITSGCGFPATLNPILHLNLTPVLVDYDLETQNISLDEVERTLEEHPDVVAIIFAHTMGNPVDMDRLMDLANKHCIAVVEDCCECLGAKYKGRHVGTFGHVGTFSFYPSHQMSGMGGGGCIITDYTDLALEARSLRNWGKLSRAPNFAGDHVTEFTNDVDGIPYDDQYTYSHIGWNLQCNDVQAAYLREQLKRLDGFVAQRKVNWEYLCDHISVPEIGVMPVVEGAEPSYFGFSIVLSTESGLKHIERDDFVNYLEANGIRSRPYFAGNILRHEPYKYLNTGIRLPVADYLMRQALFIGVWPGLAEAHMKYVADTINTYAPRWKDIIEVVGYMPILDAPTQEVHL